MAKKEDIEQLIADELGSHYLSDDSRFAHFETRFLKYDALPRSGF
jgi:hypothetical protein